MRWYRTVRRSPWSERQPSAVSNAPSFGGDVWIEHHENAAAEILIHKSDDALGNADHIGRHAHATIAMRVQRVFQVLRHGQILFGVLGCGGRLAQKWDGRHDHAACDSSRWMLPVCQYCSVAWLRDGRLGRTCPFPDRSRRLRDVRDNVCGLDWCNMLGVMEDMLQYREYMAQALELARKGAGWVDPNPLVGAVVVRWRGSRHRIP